MVLIDDPDNSPMLTMRSPSQSASRGRGSHNGGFGSDAGSRQVSRSRSTLRVPPPHASRTPHSSSSPSRRTPFPAHNDPLDHIPLQFQSLPPHARGRDPQPMPAMSYRDDIDMPPPAIPPHPRGSSGMPSVLLPNLAGISRGGGGHRRQQLHHHSPVADGGSPPCPPMATRPRIASSTRDAASGGQDGSGASCEVVSQVIDMVAPVAAGPSGGIVYACTRAIKSKIQCLIHNVAARRAADSAATDEPSTPNGVSLVAAVMRNGAPVDPAAPGGASGQVPQSRAGRKKVDYACQNGRNSKVGFDEYLGVSRQCTRCFRLRKVCIRTRRGANGNPKKGRKGGGGRRTVNGPGQQSGRKRSRSSSQSGAARSRGRSRTPSFSAMAVAMAGAASSSSPGGGARGSYQRAMVLKGDVARAPPRISIDTWTVAAGKSHACGGPFVPDISKTRLSEIASITVAQLAKLLPLVGASTKRTQLCKCKRLVCLHFV